MPTDLNMAETRAIRVVPSGKVYRQMFDAQVRFVSVKKNIFFYVKNMYRVNYGEIVRDIYATNQDKILGKHVLRRSFIYTHSWSV